MNRTPALIVLALVAGLALGLLAGATLFGAAPEGPTAVARAAGAVPTSAAPTRSASEVGLSVAGTTASRPVTRVVDDGPSAADRERAAGLADELERTAATVVTDQVGDGTIDGRVETAEGVGVAGAVVRIEPRGEEDFADPLARLEDRDGRPVDELMAEAALAALEARRGRREVRTAADGSFRFERLPDRRWRATAYLEGHRVTPTTPGADALPTGGGVLFVAEPYLEVEVRVARADGLPVEEAVVEVDSESGRGGGRERFLWTPAEPTVLLPPGEHEFTAHADLLPIPVSDRAVPAALKSEGVELYVDRAAPPPVTLVLEPADVLYGEVRFAPRFESAESLQLIVERFEGDAPPENDALGDDGDWLSPRRPLVLEDLEPGRHVLAVREGWRGGIIMTEVVDYAGGVQRHDLLIDRETGGRIVLAVYRPDGTPMADVDLRLRTGDGRRSRGSRLNAIFRNGAHHFPVPEALADGLDADERVAVEVREDDYAPAAVELRPDRSEYTIQLEPPARVVATVAGVVGESLRGRLVVRIEPLEDLDATDARGDGGTVDDDGRYVSDGLLPGRYSVVLELRDRGRGWNGRSVDRREVAIATGDNPVSLGVPPLHDFAVTTPDDSDGTWFFLVPLGAEGGGRGRIAERVDDGVVRFDEVLAGRYQLSRGGRGGSMEIDVPCSDFTYAPRSPNAVEVRVGDEDGRLARIGLVDGDLVLEIDGADLGLPSLTSSAAELLGQTTGRHRLRLLRGGDTLSLEWDAAALGNVGLGGSLTPVRIDR